MWASHAVNCTTSGAAGHAIVRDVYAVLAKLADKERSTSRRPDLRPADVLLHNLDARHPLAIDFTIWTRPPTAPRDVLDKVIDEKVALYGKVCSDEGWAYKVWAADTFGGMHPQARQLVSRLLKPLTAASRFGPAATVGTAVWRAISTAVMLRAGSQLARHSDTFDQLSWSPPVDQDPTENEAITAMGISSPSPDRLSPHPPEGCAADGLYDVTQDLETAASMDEEPDGMAGDDECMDPNAPELQHKAEGDSSNGAATSYAHNPYSADGPVSLQEGFEPPSLSQSQLAGVAWLRGRLPPPPCEADGDDEET